MSNLENSFGKTRCGRQEGGGGEEERGGGGGYARMLNNPINTLMKSIPH